jgi:hypothetical protein
MAGPKTKFDEQSAHRMLTMFARSGEQERLIAGNFEKAAIERLTDMALGMGLFWYVPTTFLTSASTLVHACMYGVMLEHPTGASGLSV